MSLLEVSVVYLVRPGPAGPEVLLGRKLTGLGVGKVVAPGGKLEPGETPKAAAARELFEETGLEVPAESLELIGELTYTFPTKLEWSQKSWAFTTRGHFGYPVPSDELLAFWISIDDIPFDEMWDDASYWLSDALKGVKTRNTFEFGADLSTVAMSDHPSFQ